MSLPNTCSHYSHLLAPAPLTPLPQTLQDSGYSSHTEKRRGDHDAGDKENASPNKNKVRAFYGLKYQLAQKPPFHHLMPWHP